jgi:hypothetical protein
LVAWRASTEPMAWQDIAVVLGIVVALLLVMMLAEILFG